MGKIIQIDLEKPEESNWMDVLAQDDKRKIQSSGIVNGKLMVIFLQDASDRLEIFDVSSIPAQKLTNIELPDIGTIVNSVGKHNKEEFFFSFSSYTDPGSSYRVDMNTFKMEKIHKTKLRDSSIDFNDFVTD